MIGSKAIIIGDSFNNTLGLIRSLGEGGVEQTVILIGDTDRLYIKKSRYLKKSNIYQISNFNSCLELLLSIADKNCKDVLLCTNDKAATFIDENEEVLSKYYQTPMNGKKLGNYMNKDKQCLIAKECGFDVPQSLIYHKGDDINIDFRFPLIIKPLSSIKGEKSDIHICNDINELKQNLYLDSSCYDFLIQEFIEKEYEINIVGISTDNGVLAPGGIQKIRYYPEIYSPCSFGHYRSISNFNFDIKPLQKFMDKIGYRGLFSIELLHCNGKNYFLEVNFRNDGLAYAATVAGVNFPVIFLQNTPFLRTYNINNIYMMDLSSDYCHVKDGNISWFNWFSCFIKTRCQLNFNWKDISPTRHYYKAKIKSKLFRCKL